MAITSEEQAIQHFARRGVLTLMVWSLPAGLITGQLISMTLGLTGGVGLVTMGLVMLPLSSVLGLAYPYGLLHFLASHALRPRLDDQPGARLTRILRLPWIASCLGTPIIWTLGGLLFSSLLTLWQGLEPQRIIAGTLIPACFGVVLAAPISLRLEKLVLPLALEEQRKHPTLTATGSGVFWPRQSWFLPFTYVSSMLATLLIGASVVLLKVADVRGNLRMKLGAEQATLLAGELRHVFLVDLGSSLLWLCVLVLVLPTLTYWMLARRQAEGAEAVEAAIEGLASGQVVAPAWVSTDEMGDLASGMNRVLERLRQLPRMLQGSASRLLSAGIHLSMANESQQQSLSRQAAALQEAQVTSAEIEQTSQMASERAEMVLRVAERAEQLGQSGEAAIEQTLAGLASIREVVEEIQRKLARLETSATQIGSITQTVKSLADRSNMLAVNAAIEAVRSGEHGKGFAVLAREVRALANQSIAATGRIGEVLDEVSLAVQDAASMGDHGAQQISNGLERLKVSGESLRGLSKISQENMAAVRQIAAAVTQQNAGLSQIFTAIGDLAENMQETLGRLEATQEAALTLQTVSTEVTEMAQEFNAG